MTPATIGPNFDVSKIIESSARTDSNMCWNCNTCDMECPINIATNRLRPQKLIHMAKLGMLEELVHLPEIWYCLTCNRCNQTCPNHVRPADLVCYLRGTALERKIVSHDAFLQYRFLFGDFQRVRWHAAMHCIKGDSEAISDDRRQQWQGSQVTASGRNIAIRNLHPKDPAFHKAVAEAKTLACFTCSECSNTCPLMHKRSVFDPQAIIRMVNLGLIEDVLSSPAIWLCIGCGRCADACSQQVDGRLIMQSLKELALKNRFVDAAFAYRLEKAAKAIYPQFLDSIDALLFPNQGRCSN